MNRRTLLKSIAATSVASTVAAVAQQKPLAKPRDLDQSYMAYVLMDDYGVQWKIAWTGWKYCIHGEYLVGQAVACAINGDGSRDKAKWGIYASLPGFVGVCAPFEEFDISLQEGQPLISALSSEEEKDAGRDRCVDALYRYLFDVVQHDPKVTPYLVARPSGRVT